MATALREIRLKKRMSQGELAEKSGITRQTICTIERNPDYNASLKTMKQLADALGVPVKRLFLP